MRLGGRLAAAIEILDDLDRRQRPASAALKDWGATHRFAGAGDRAAIGNIVYDALRRKRSAAWLIGTDTPRAAAFGALLLMGGHTLPSINEALSADRFAPEPLTADEQASLAAKDLGTAPDVIRADLPAWCLDHFQRAFGHDWVREGQGLASRPPLDMRANTLKSDRARVLKELSAAGAVATTLASQGMRIAPVSGAGRHPNVQGEPAFLKGWFEVQDEGSQIMAELAGAEPAGQVLDFCAGAGGKTLALSALMGNRGQIFAHDSNHARLAPIFERLKRAGCRNVQVVSGTQSLALHEGSMDMVLVDAPCTGSGTWRRHPDAKWHLTRRQLESRVAEQRLILEQAARYVRPGGLLVYVTCSLLPDENRDQIGFFLERMTGFRPIDHHALWQQRFASRGLARIDRHGIDLTPARTGTDGFFFCALRSA